MTGPAPSSESGEPSFSESSSFVFIVTTMDLPVGSAEVGSIYLDISGGNLSILASNVP